MVKNEKERNFECCVCGEEHGIEDIYEFKVKEKTKQICKECADTVHGLI